MGFLEQREVLSQKLCAVIHTSFNILRALHIFVLKLNTHAP